jgi:hypothetical protein
MTMAPISETELRKLTVCQRNMLIGHIDGEVDVTICDPHKVQSRNALIGQGYLRGSPTGAVRPRTTVLTERGRAMLGMVLGDYADALIRAGILDQQHPLEVLKHLKLSRGDARDQFQLDVPKARLASRNSKIPDGH